MQVTVVTLVVTPDEAERLTLASTEGKIQLALRNPLDLESPGTAGVKPGMLMGTVQQRPAPVARRPTVAGEHDPHRLSCTPAPTVEIIRGDKRQHVTVG